VIFELRPPVGAGAPLTGTTGHDVVEVLRQLGVPLSLCRTRGSRPAWAVHRPSGLMICTYFDADDRLEAIEFGRPDSDDDAVTTAGMTCSRRQRLISSPGCGASPPSTRTRPGTPSPPPACFLPCGGRSRQPRRKTRKAGSSKASFSPGRATTTIRLSQTRRCENDHSTVLTKAPRPAKASCLHSPDVSGRQSRPRSLMAAPRDRAPGFPGLRSQQRGTRFRRTTRSRTDRQVLPAWLPGSPPTDGA
jgi:hypothetical protein